MPFFLKLRENAYYASSSAMYPDFSGCQSSVPEYRHEDRLRDPSCVESIRL